MSRFVAASPMPVSADRLYRWHLAPGALERLIPPWEAVRVARAEPPGEGSEAELVLGSGPFRLRWLARHAGLIEARQFQDVQVRGPFARWVHTHRMRVSGADRSTLEDEIDYRLPLAPVADLVAGGYVRRRLQRTFTWRHAQTAADLARHASFAGRGPLRVAVTGASGLVGRQAVAFLRTGGHRVLILVRRQARQEDERSWDPVSGTLDSGGLEGVDAVVHLAGENIAAGRWNAERKRRIRDSRVRGTSVLAEALARLERPPRVLVAASAIGYYGDRGDETVDETSPAGTGFLAETCREWEGACAPASAAGVRVVSLRIGIVVSARGGALARMLPLFRLGLGGRLGHGRQWMSWIAHDDLIGVLHQALFDERLEGPINAVAPGAVTNAEFTRSLGRVLRRPTPLPAPAAALRLVLGEMGEQLLLTGARVAPRGLEQVGFAFRFGQLDQALRSELGRSDDRTDRPRFHHGPAVSSD